MKRRCANIIYIGKSLIKNGFIELDDENRILRAMPMQLFANEPEQTIFYNGIIMPLPIYIDIKKMLQSDKTDFTIFFKNIIEKTGFAEIGQKCNLLLLNNVVCNPLIINDQTTIEEI